MDTLEDIIRSIGVRKTADSCGVSPRAVYKWMSQGRLPRTDHTGETHYAETLAQLAGGSFQPHELLEHLRQVAKDSAA